MTNPLGQEPVLVLAGGLGSVASALTAVVFSFVHTTDAQQASITAAVGVLTALVTALLARGRVTPTAPLEELANAVDAPAAPIPPVAEKAVARRRRS